jgi:hypothetical protein
LRRRRCTVVEDPTTRLEFERERETATAVVDEQTLAGHWVWSEREVAQQGVVRHEECKDLRSSLLRRIAVLCPFVGSAVGSRCLTARGYKKEIEWVLERDGWSTFGILT